MAEPPQHDLLYGAADDRRKRVVELVAETGFRSVPELARELGVSQMTVRRDIRRLAEEGSVRDVHGGVSVFAAIKSGVDFGQRTTRNQRAKFAIAERAADTVEPDAVIAIDAGTTALEVARALPHDLPCTVLTHSLPAMALLAGRPRVQLIGLGGVFHDRTQAFHGPAGLTTLHGLRAGTLFLGATSIHDGALYASNPYDTEMKVPLIQISQRVVLVADSSKFSVVALMRVTGLGSVHTLITDDGIDPEMRATCERAGIEVHTVAVPTSDLG
jgi:DeoR/GlpR family transcriptional regulator of sugar metabolism